MTMDYGPDWPPAPEPAPKPKRKGWTLARQCAAAVVVYIAITVIGLLLLHVRQEHAPAFDPYRTPPAAATHYPGP